MSKLYMLTARAVERPGYEGFCRGGLRWPSAEDRTECVTQGLLNLIKAERHVSIMDIQPVESAPEGMVVRDIPEPLYVDHAARAVDEAKRLDAEAAGLQAQIELEAKRARVAQLREELIKTKAAADVAEAPKPVATETKNKK